MVKKTFWILVCNCLVISLFSQPVSTSSKRAEKLYQEARELSLYRKFTEAEEAALKSIQIDNAFIEAYLLLAELYYGQNKIEKSMEMYEKGLLIDPSFYPLGFYNMGVLQYNNGLYQEALKSFARYVEYQKDDIHNQDYLDYYTECCHFALSSIKNPVQFEPVNLGSNVNSEYGEYWPSLSADESMLVFTVLLPIDKSNPQAFQNRQEDFYVSYRDEEGWTEAKSLGKPLNTGGNEGAQTISADGRVMVYTACNRRDGEGRCDLYIAEREGAQWLPPKNMRRPINTVAKETQPSLSYDGRTLYFASDRAGSKGGLDIWYATQNTDGTWNQPVNLGDSINTGGDEMSPFIHHDNQTLYFSSERHVGMGGFDLYRSTLTSDSTWSKPVNLGYPVNTHNDEMGLIVNAFGNMAYYSSNRRAGYSEDIYRFEMPLEHRPSAVSYLKGKVFDAVTKSPLGASFELVDLNTGKLVNQSVADAQTGSFLLTLPPEINYMINVSHPGYLFYSENIEITGQYKKDEPFLVDIPLQPIQEGINMVLRNIFYQTDKYALKQESEYELVKVVNFLNDNPKVDITITGHTDSVGTAAYNKQLSEKRADEVAGFIIGKGIDASRVKAVGMGQEMPIAENTTAEGRAKNRRTELTISRVND